MTGAFDYQANSGLVSKYHAMLDVFCTFCFDNITGIPSRGARSERAGQTGLIVVVYSHGIKRVELSIHPSLRDFLASCVVELRPRWMAD
jgi:hypothetical protein